MGTGIQHKSRTPGDVINSSAVWAEEHEITGHIVDFPDAQIDIGNLTHRLRRIYLVTGGLGGTAVVEAGDLDPTAIVTHHVTIDHTAAMLKEGIQPFNSNIEFTPYGTVGGAPDSHDSIQWTAGTIQFADGTTLSITIDPHVLDALKRWMNKEGETNLSAVIEGFIDSSIRDTCEGCPYSENPKQEKDRRR